MRKPLLPVLAILVALFASYTAAVFLSDAVNGLLPVDIIAELVGLKVLISLEVLIPVSLYIAVVLSFARLHGDSEFTAAFALRLTPRRMQQAVLVLSAALAIVVGVLSLVVRPWAYQQIHALSARSEGMLNVEAMQAGTFYVGQHGNRVIFLAHRDGPHSPARDVFVQLWRGDSIRVIHARLAGKLPRTAARDGRVILRDAHIYDIGLGAGQADQILDARDFIINPDRGRDPASERGAVDASSARLASSDAAPDIAEFQWRLSTPISTLLLGLLGIPMSRGRPQQSRYARLGAAILAYVGYYMLCTSARTWVQHGAVASFPGIWWVPSLLSLFLLAALYGPRKDAAFSGGRA